jgi:hypothetical protein
MHETSQLWSVVLPLQLDESTPSTAASASHAFATQEMESAPGKAPVASQDQVTESPVKPSSHDAVQVSANINPEQLDVSTPTTTGKVLSSHGLAAHEKLSAKSPGEWSALPPQKSTMLLPV